MARRSSQIEASHFGQNILGAQLAKSSSMNSRSHCYKNIKGSLAAAQATGVVADCGSSHFVLMCIYKSA
ncbi:hypothetical protein FRC18_000241 [Serendipita sp. 400]|nr:hypothetical protein FRC18_000241 [Serendipita sp. 400]